MKNMPMYLREDNSHDFCIQDSVWVRLVNACELVVLELNISQIFSNVHWNC
jgi:hypothetical protein